MTKAPIFVELIENCDMTRHRCSVCLGWTKKWSYALARAQCEEGNVLVCETCLESAAIDENLARSAELLVNHGLSQLRLIGRLKVPSFADWKRRCEELEAGDMAERTAAENDTSAPWERDRPMPPFSSFQ